MAFLGYLGFLAGLKVWGLLKWTVVRTFLTLVPCLPLTTFFCTLTAFCTCLAGAFLGAAALVSVPSAFFLTGAAFFGTGFFLAAAAVSTRTEA
jgi:hypothetical protein